MTAEQMQQDYPRVRSLLATSRNEAKSLKGELRILAAELAEARRALASMQKRYIGRVGEELVAELTAGVIQHNKAPFDILTASGHRVEVKASKSNLADRYSASRKWQWSNLQGGRVRPKNYEYLFLLGERDVFLKRRDDEEGDFVLFCVPAPDVRNLVTEGGGVSCMTSLRGWRSAGIGRRYRVTEAWVRGFFGNRENAGLQPTIPAA
ncbi:hypothetical protein GCM10027081_18310 [Cupriavidus yeoncheonensis]